MALATRCPACSTVFRISTAQATAKGGTVRCGQCRHVFDSLDALVRVEDLEVIEEVQVTSSGNDASLASSASTPSTASTTEPLGAEPGRDDAVAMQAAEPIVPDARAPDHLPAEVGSDEPATEVATVAATVAGTVAATGAGSRAAQASDDRPTAGEWWLPDPADSAAMPLLPLDSAPPDAEPAAIDDREDAGRLLSGRGGDLQATGIGPSAGPAFLTAGDRRPRLGRAARWTLGIGSLLSTIVLAGQLGYLWRDELAVRWPPARPWLAAACGPLRCTVGYPAHLEWITIESATIQTTGAGLDLYVLNVLLRNRASSDVRYPHLELVLTDLQDRPILRRALRPEDYLPAVRDAAGRVGASAQTGFAANSELPIRLTFELGDLRFAGYRVDKFYP